MLKMIRVVSLFILTGIIASGVTSCKDDEPFATVTFTGTSNKSGDLRGDGGSTTTTFTFQNPNTTAGWDMSITASAGSSFNLVLKDASGAVMLDQTLTATASSGSPSADGTTIAGRAGAWTGTVTLTSFNGTGDYSVL